MLRRYKLSALTAWLLCAAACLGAFISVGVLLVQHGQAENALKLVGDAVWILFTIPFSITAALIISRQPGNVIGWLLMEPALLLILAGPIDAYLKNILTPPSDPGFLFLLIVWFSNWDWLAVIFPILIIALLFPDGQPPSPRWRWVLFLAGIFCAVFLFIATFAQKLGPVNVNWTVSNPIGFLNESSIQTIVGLLLPEAFLTTVLCAASLVVRYRRAKGGERKQIKWLMYACCLFALIYIPGDWINNSGSGDNLIANFFNLVLGLAIFTFPISIAIAILHYHLWDIDLVIRRTLLYAVLTAVLAGLYYGLVLLFGQLFQAFSGQDSPVGVVLSTLIIASLFTPLRLQLQGFIDRRFYRQKYNAEQAVAAFAAAARSETALNAITSQMVSVVEKTVQPEQVWLWMKDGEQER